MPITLPVASFGPSKTVFASKCIAVFTSKNGVVTNIISKVGQIATKQSTVECLFPGTDNIMRPQRSCMKDAEERFELVDMENVDDVLTFMGGFTGSHRLCSCVLWICEQDDPTGTSVRYRTNAFLCSVTVKGGTTKYGGGDFAKISLDILSLEPTRIVFNPNASDGSGASGFSDGFSDGFGGT